MYTYTIIRKANILTFINVYYNGMCVIADMVVLNSEVATLDSDTLCNLCVEEMHNRVM